MMAAWIMKQELASLNPVLATMISKIIQGFKAHFTIKATAGDVCVPGTLY